jgi:hypothetical protein
MTANPTTRTFERTTTLLKARYGVWIQTLVNHSIGIEKGRLPVNVPERARAAHHSSRYRASPGTRDPTHRIGR